MSCEYPGELRKGGPDGKRGERSYNWVLGRSPQRGPDAEHLVRGKSPWKATLEAERFLAFERQMGVGKIAFFSVFCGVKVLWEFSTTGERTETGAGAGSPVKSAIDMTPRSLPCRPFTAWMTELSWCVLNHHDLSGTSSAVVITAGYYTAVDGRRFVMKTLHKVR